MPQPSTLNSVPLPTWVIVAGSLAIAVHLLVFGVSALAARSGPWPAPYGRDYAPPPQFTMALDEFFRANYLRPLKMTHNYHFQTNQAEAPAGWFEVRLKDETGAPLKTVRIPEENANPWVRHRQALLAFNLLQDEPLPPQAGERLPAPGQTVRMMPIWDVGMDGVRRISPVPEHLVPRDRPVFRPSELSLTLAKSYARYLCRLHGAASAELVRHRREPIPPMVLFQLDLPPGANEELVASFGELTR